MPSCTDGLVNGVETGLDCGGPAGDAGCARCGADAGCRGPLDCLSGTCEPGNVCSVPSYVWNTTAFSVCSAAACNTGTQSRAVTCLRSDNVAVDDSFCTGTRPASTQSCTNLTGCSWDSSVFGGCSTTCGSGLQTRTVRCRRPDTTTAPDSFCPSPKPVTSQTCFLNSGCSWFIGGYGPAAFGVAWAARCARFIVRTAAARWCLIRSVRPRSCRRPRAARPLNGSVSMSAFWGSPSEADISLSCSSRGEQWVLQIRSVRWAPLDKLG